MKNSADHFDVIGSIIFGGLHFWRHWFNMAKILSKFGEQQLVMVNYAYGFNQIKYFEWIIIIIINSLLFMLWSGTNSLEQLIEPYPFNI